MSHWGPRTHLLTWRNSQIGTWMLQHEVIAKKIKLAMKVCSFTQRCLILSARSVNVFIRTLTINTSYETQNTQTKLKTIIFQPLRHSHTGNQAKSESPPTLTSSSSFMIFLIRARGNSCTRKSFWKITEALLGSAKRRVHKRWHTCEWQVSVPQSGSWSPPWPEARRTAGSAGRRCRWLRTCRWTSSSRLQRGESEEERGGSVSMSNILTGTVRW